MNYQLITINSINFKTKINIIYLTKQKYYKLKKEVDNEMARQGEQIESEKKVDARGGQQMISSEYANAYTEVLEILKYIPKEDYNKIPKETLEYSRDFIIPDTYIRDYKWEE